jgi:protein-L-isoaspartate(D-aspartate) O-methyltransferase
MTNEDLISELIATGYLKTPSIIEAFRKVDRAAFVPEGLKHEAYYNTALPIGEGQTISQPLVVAFMLELLKPKEGQKILEIGTGSGWVAGLLAEIVKEGGIVVSIERIPELSKIAQKNLERFNYIKLGILKLLTGDGTKGCEEDAPYDRIIAGAAGVKIPEAWKEQLKLGGRIVAPVSSSIVMLEKVDFHKFKEESYYGFSFVPLVEDET